MAKKISISVDLKHYTAATIRYAAYAVSGEAYALLEPDKKDGILVTLEPKPGASGAGLKKRFEAELKDEKLRSAIAASNKELREFMVLKALSPAAVKTADEGSGLTPVQEKELDALIAQVEREIKDETAGKKPKNSLGITATWEEKYEPQHERKTKK